MSDDGQRELHHKYLAHKGEPWHIPQPDVTRYRSLTQAERIDRLERNLKMGRYADE